MKKEQLTSDLKFLINEWKLYGQNDLSIGIDNKFAEYKPKIESDSLIILSREYNGKIFSYYFKKGW